MLKQPEWHDFGPTFASEQLAKRYDIQVSKETVRGWMVSAGLWRAQSRKLGEKHFWRPRRRRIVSRRCEEGRSFGNFERLVFQYNHEARLHHPSW